MTLLPGLRENVLASDVGLLVLRLAVGVVFIAHGWGDASQDGGAATNIANYRDAGIPLPELSAWFGAAAHPHAAPRAARRPPTRPEDVPCSPQSME